MKRTLSILLITTLILGSLSVYAATALNEESDGDVVKNPWGETFTTVAPTTNPPITTTVTDPQPTSSGDDEPSTNEPTTVPNDEPTTVAPTTQDPALMKKPRKVTLRKPKKKLSAKKVKIKYKKVKGATGYIISVYKTKKKAKKDKKAILTKETTKVKVWVKSKKLKNKKKLFVKVRAYVAVGEMRVCGKWSKIKKVKIRKSKK